MAEVVDGPGRDAHARAPGMIDEDDHNYPSDDAAPLLTKNYGSCATACRTTRDGTSGRAIGRA